MGQADHLEGGVDARLHGPGSTALRAQGGTSCLLGSGEGWLPAMGQGAGHGIVLPARALPCCARANQAG